MPAPYAWGTCLLPSPVLDALHRESGKAKAEVLTFVWGPMENLESEADTLGLTSVSRSEESQLSYWTRTLEKPKLRLLCTKNLACGRTGY